MAKLPLERSRFQLPSGEGVTTNTLPLIRAGAYYEAAGRDLTAAGAVMMRYLQEEQAEREQERGQEEGSQVQFGRDETGRLVPVLADETAHRAYRKAFNEAAIAKYLATVQLDATSELTRIRQEAGGEPDVFRERAQAWIEGAAEKMPGLVAVPFRAMAGHVAGQHHVKLVEEKAKREIEQARVTSSLVIDKAMQNLFDVVSRGGQPDHAIGAVENAIKQAGNIFTPAEIQKMGSQARVLAGAARGIREVRQANGGAAGFSIAEALAVGPSHPQWRSWMNGLDLDEREAVRMAVHAAAAGARQIMEMRREDAFQRAREQAAQALAATGGDPEALMKTSESLKQNAWRQGVNAGVFLSAAQQAENIAEAQQGRLLADLDEQIRFTMDTLEKQGARPALARVAALQGAMDGVPMTPAVRQRMDQLTKLEGAAWAAFATEEAQNLESEFAEFEASLSKREPREARDKLEWMRDAWQSQIEKLPAALRAPLSATLAKRAEQMARAVQQGIRARIDAEVNGIKAAIAALPSARNEDEVQGLFRRLLDHRAQAGLLLGQLDVSEAEKTALSTAWLELERRGGIEAKLAKAGRLIADYIEMGTRVTSTLQERQALQEQREGLRRELGEMLKEDPSFAMQVTTLIAQMGAAEQNMMANVRSPAIIRVQNALERATRQAAAGALTEADVESVKTALMVLRGMTPPLERGDSSDPHALVRKRIEEFEGDIAKLWQMNEVANQKRDNAAGAANVAATVAQIAALLKGGDLHSETLDNMFRDLAMAQSEAARNQIGQRIIAEHKKIVDRTRMAAVAIDLARGSPVLVEASDEEKNLALLAIVDPKRVQHWVETGERVPLTEAELSQAFGGPDGGRIMARVARSDIVGPEVSEFFKRLVNGMVMTDVEDQAGRGVATNLDLLLQQDPESWHVLRNAADRGLQRSETFGGVKAERPPMNPVDVLTVLGGTANWQQLREVFRKGPTEEQWKQAREKVENAVQSLRDGSWFPGGLKVVNEPSDAMRSRWLARALLLEMGSLPGSSLRSDAAMDKLVRGDQRYGLSSYALPQQGLAEAMTGMITSGFFERWYNKILVFTQFPIEAFGAATVDEAKKRAERAASSMIARMSEGTGVSQGVFSSTELGATVHLLAGVTPEFGRNLFLVPQALMPQSRDVRYQIVMATNHSWVRVVDNLGKPVELELDDLIRTSSKNTQAEVRQNYRYEDVSISDMAAP